MNKLFLSTLLLSLSFSVFSTENYITVGSDTVNSIDKSINIEVVAERNGKSILKIKKGFEGFLSTIMHNEFKRCGGFFAHENLEEAQKELNNDELELLSKRAIFSDYSINQQNVIEPLIEQVNDVNIESTIRHMSSFHNRYYQAQTGVDSQQWLKQKWESLSQERSDVTVENFNHSRWKQPSIILTILGSELPDEIIVVGGHADSIAGYWGRSAARAPGADDNASGIATMTEAMRVLFQNSYQPKRTIKFMAYAAEEVGLLGSREIAQSFKQQNKEVLGVLQLDMTNFNGTKSKDIVMMSDYTNQEQNTFIGTLIDEYVKLPWGYDRCGYACSDHASWHSSGFPASIPFEARKNDMNKKIHTDRDVIEQSGGHARHAAKFAKLAVAFIVELDR